MRARALISCTLHQPPAAHPSFQLQRASLQPGEPQPEYCVLLQVLFPTSTNIECSPRKSHMPPHTDEYYTCPSLRRVILECSFTPRKNTLVEQISISVHISPSGSDDLLAYGRKTLKSTVNFRCRRRSSRMRNSIIRSEEHQTQHPPNRSAAFSPTGDVCYSTSSGHACPKIIAMRQRVKPVTPQKSPLLGCSGACSARIWG